MPGQAAPHSPTPGPAPATTAPLVVLYDGQCNFCVAGSRRLASFAKPGSIKLVNAHDPAALARFPQVTHAAAVRALQLVEPSGRVHSGAAAIAAALNTRPLWRLVTWLYRVPGIHALTDRIYDIVARNRYRIAGRRLTCESGACAIRPEKSHCNDTHPQRGIS